MAKEKPKTWMFQTVNCWAHRKPQFRIAQGPVATDNPPQMGTDSLQPDVVLIEAPCCGGITRHDLLGQIARSDTGASLGKDPDLPRLLWRIFEAQRVLGGPGSDRPWPGFSEDQKTGGKIPRPILDGRCFVFFFKGIQLHPILGI